MFIVYTIYNKMSKHASGRPLFNILRKDGQDDDNISRRLW